MSTINNQEPMQLMLLPEVAAYCRTSVATVRYWILTKKLPSIRPGRRRMVYKEDLDKFIDGTLQPADTDYTSND